MIVFCGKDETVFVDERKHKLSLSVLMKWFEKDLCDSKDRMPKVMLQFLLGEKKEALARMIQKASREKKKLISIKYLPYDWSANASQFQPYKASNLKPNEKSPAALVRQGSYNCKSGGAKAVIGTDVPSPAKVSKTLNHIHMTADNVEVVICTSE